MQHKSGTALIWRDINDVYLPHVDIELKNSAYISVGLSWV